MKDSSNSSSSSNNLLKKVEAATYFGVSRSSLTRMIAAGMPSIKVVGVGRRILKAEAEAWLRVYKPRKKKALSNGLQKTKAALISMQDGKDKQSQAAQAEAQLEPSV